MVLYSAKNLAMHDILIAPQKPRTHQVLPLPEITTRVWQNSCTPSPSSDAHPACGLESLITSVTRRLRCITVPQHAMTLNLLHSKAIYHLFHVLVQRSEVLYSVWKVALILCILIILGLLRRECLFNLYSSAPHSPNPAETPVSPWADPTCRLVPFL